ncbi:hypothetical protein ACP70R_000559 [Stipagrostis hirtigluma subsp. patula]
MSPAPYPSSIASVPPLRPYYREQMAQNHGKTPLLAKSSFEVTPSQLPSNSTEENSVHREAPPEDNEVHISNFLWNTSGQQMVTNLYQTFVRDNDTPVRRTNLIQSFVSPRNAYGPTSYISPNQIDLPAIFNTELCFNLDELDGINESSSITTTQGEAPMYEVQNINKTIASSHGCTPNQSNGFLQSFGRSCAAPSFTTSAVHYDDIGSPSNDGGPKNVYGPFLECVMRDQQLGFNVMRSHASPPSGQRGAVPDIVQVQGSLVAGEIHSSMPGKQSASIHPLQSDEPDYQSTRRRGPH